MWFFWTLREHRFLSHWPGTGILYILGKLSQNHRMVGVGRDLCESSSPTPLPKQGLLQQAAHGLVQAGLDYLQRRRHHSLPGQPVPVFRHPQSEEVPPHVQSELLMLHFVPIAFCPVAGHHWKQSVPILLTPTLLCPIFWRSFPHLHMSVPHMCR